ncbi:MAG: flagellar motor protein MotB [Bryobacteraceae bacterium]
MARKKKHAAHENHERWLVSYADFITLLFAFFVVMFASSQADKNKAKQVSESVRRAMEEGQVAGMIAGILGGKQEVKRGAASKPKEAPKPEPQKLAELSIPLAALTAELKEDIDAGRLLIAMEKRGLVISLRQSAFFAPGEDTVDPKSYDSIAKICAAIRKVNNPVRLEGHTDALPIHNARFQSNWELSAARAIAMLNVFVDRFQVPPDRLAVVGYAAFAPVDSNESEAGRAHNRRVDVVLLSEAGMAPEPERAKAKQ